MSSCDIRGREVVNVLALTARVVDEGKDVITAHITIRDYRHSVHTIHWQSEE